MGHFGTAAALRRVHPSPRSHRWKSLPRLTLCNRRTLSNDSYGRGASRDPSWTPHDPDSFPSESWARRHPEDPHRCPAVTTLPAESRLLVAVGCLQRFSCSPAPPPWPTQRPLLHQQQVDRPEPVSARHCPNQTPIRPGSRASGGLIDSRGLDCRQACGPAVRAERCIFRAVARARATLRRKGVDRMRDSPHIHTSRAGTGSSRARREGGSRCSTSHLR